MIWLGLVVFMASAHAENVLGSLCSNGMTMRDLHSVIETLGPLAGPERKSCGLYGEAAAKICKSCTDELAPDQMQIVKSMVGDRAHRKWHQEWHQTRRGLNELGLPVLMTEPVGMRGVLNCPVYTSKDPADIALTQWLGDSPVRNYPTAKLTYAKKDADVAREYTASKKVDLNAFANDHRAVTGRLAGEDFLYMHREMIKMVQVKLTTEDKPCLAPWTDIPGAGDPNWPTAIRKHKDLAYAAPIEGTTREQRDEMNQNALAELVKRMRSPEYLKQVSLNDLGLCIENSLHAFMHMKYADQEIKCENEFDTSPDCDHLLPEYSSHVSPYFWKIHGLVDELMGSWLKARGKTEIAEECHKFSCYQWPKGVWKGEPPATEVRGVANAQ